jgi:hypothetical protein
LLFFRKHDRQGRGRLNLGEFTNAFLPFSREYASLVTDRPDYYSSRGYDYTRFFNPETRLEMKSVWAAIFKAEHIMEKIRFELSRRPYYNSR